MSEATTSIKVISGGAFKQVLNALAEQYQKASGSKLDLTYRTVGQHLKLIESGAETFDVAVLTPEAIDGLIKDGKMVAGTRADLAKTGVGVVVKAGAPLPDIGSVDAFKRTLMAAKSVAYIDPAAGGSSGIYVGKLLQRRCEIALVQGSGAGQLQYGNTLQTGGDFVEHRCIVRDEFIEFAHAQHQGGGIATRYFAEKTHHARAIHKVGGPERVNHRHRRLRRHAEIVQSTSVVAQSLLRCRDRLG